MKIIGIDPSINQTGIACIDLETGKLVSTSLIESDRKMDFFHREKQISSGVWRFVEAQSNEMIEIALEWAGFHTYGRNNLKSLAILHYLTGIIKGMMGNYPVFCYTPKEWKGNSSKKETQILIKEVYNFEPQREKEHHLCDAIGLADYHIRKRKNYNMLKQIGVLNEDT